MSEKRSWDKIVKYALENQETIQSMRERRKKKEFERSLKRLIPIPILVGILAGLIMYYRYGLDSLLEVLLTWTIGLTIIATIIAYLPKHLKN